MERPKRCVPKPSRYQTTSSDEAPKRRRSTIQSNIDLDINDLRTHLLEEDSSMDEEINHSNTNIYHISNPKHTYTYTPSQTQNMSHTHFPSFLSLENNSSQSQTHTYSTHFPAHNHTLIDNTHSRNTDINNKLQKTQLSEEGRSGIINERSLDESNNPVLNQRLDHFEAELKKINGLLQNIFKCVQHLKNNRRRAPSKPSILPISTVQEMEIFEDIDDEGYSEIVNYFEFIGGFTLKEAVNLCLKEALTDSLTPSFTWWGREGGPRPLYKTRLILAIYDAVCNNLHINNPTRAEFQVQMREALRTAKERCRSRIRGSRSFHTANRRPRDFWNDERHEGENKRTDN